MTFLSGAIVLLTNTSQMDVLPPGVAFQPDGRDGMDGTHLYREVPFSMAAEAKYLRAELQVAVDALTVAARALKEGNASPYKANLIHQAAQRAMKVLAGEVAVDA